MNTQAQSNEQGKTGNGKVRLYTADNVAFQEYDSWEDTVAYMASTTMKTYRASFTNPYGHKEKVSKKYEVSSLKQAIDMAYDETHDGGELRDYKVKSVDVI